MGQARHEMGEQEAAIKTYRSYRQRLPYLPAIDNNLGRAYEAVGEDEHAEVAYRRGLEIYPGNPTLTGNLASVLRKKGDPERALELYEGVERGSRTAEIHHNLGLIYAERGDLDGALDSYKEALRLDPSMGEVRYSLAGLYLLKDRYDEAVATYEGFLEGWDGNPAYVRRARRRLAQLYPVVGDRSMARGDLEGARKAYEGLVALGDGTAQVHHNLALIYRRKGEGARALAVCRQALAMEPDFAEANFTLGGLLEGAGDRRGALEAYSTFLRLWKGEEGLARHVRERVRNLESQGQSQTETARPR